MGGVRCKGGYSAVRNVLIQTHNWVCLGNKEGLRVLKIWILLIAPPEKDSRSGKIWAEQIPHEKKLNSQTKLSLTGNLFVLFAFSKREPVNRNHEVWVS